jgi:outer membrane protein assembly factor BamC
LRARPAPVLALLLAVTALLGGCSSSEGLFEGKKVDYKSAGKLPPLDVPPDLTTPSRDDRYPVPEAGRSATTLSGYQAERAQVRPGTGVVLPPAEGVRVARDGNQRWLVVDTPAEKLWPQVKEFWQENGFLLRQELPAAGIMETDWAENRALISDSWMRRALGGLLEQAHSTPERDKYRTRLERTPSGGTEIYISHRGMMEIYVTEARAETMWQPRPPDPELEAEFLRRLMVRLGAPEEKAKAMLAEAPPPQQHAALNKGLDGQEQLEVFEPFDRAWRRVGLALDRVGFTVEDRDRQKGLYFVRYADPEAEIERQKRDKGMFSWLAFWRSDGPKVKAEQYRVAVSGETANSRVQVLDKNGAVEASVASRRILALLHEQLK